MDTTPIPSTKNQIRRLALSAMFMAVGIVLPFLTGQIQQIGNMLLPMHLPVFLCALICGWQYGGTVGLLTPLLRSAMFGMPVIFPSAVSMAAELAVYGLAAGFLYGMWKKQNVISVYTAMIPAMLLGRAVWGAVQLTLLSFSGSVFTFEMFLAGAFLNAVPGIILQLVLIPAVMSVLHHTGVLRFRNGQR